jgi:putative FmdB family regulatory protein
MPVYEYLCAECGPFTSLRAMSDYEKPSDCPDCGAQAPRVLLTAPRLSTMTADRRLAHATNERSANAPQTLSEKLAHGAGCSCCGSGEMKRSRQVNRSKGGAKSFPTSRPWMISH